MNILPLILSTLLIMAYVSSSFFKERQATIWEERSYLGFMLAERKAREKLASIRYQRTASEKSKPDESTKKTKTATTKFINRRDKEHLSELSKLNIAPLFSHHFKPLYEIAAGLIKELYKDASFFKNSKIKNLEYALLDSIIAEAKKNEKAVELRQLFPEDSALHPIFYKMIKGTHNNYPSLEKYITIERKLNRKLIHFQFASIPLLVATFGPSATQAILDFEYQQWQEDGKIHSVPKHKLVEILENQRKKPFPFYKIEEYLEFSEGRALKTHVTAKDPETQITVTKEL
jgi:hypothetical protein